MLLICHNPSFTERTVKGDSAAWLEEMERRGVRKHGDAAAKFGKIEIRPVWQA
jgi:hypothetical protein